MRKRKKLKHAVFVWLVLFCTLTGMFAGFGVGAQGKVAEAASYTCPMEGYDKRSQKNYASIGWYDTLSSNSYNYGDFCFLISAFGGQVPVSGSKYTYAELSAYLRRSMQVYYYTASCSFCGSSCNKVVDKSDFDQYVIISGLAYNASDNTYTLGTVTLGSVYAAGEGYKLDTELKGTHTYTLSHTCTNDCRERLHTHIDTHDETEYTYTCSNTATWYYSYADGTSSTTQSCGHLGKAYSNEHYCTACGEYVYTEWVEGCTTSGCSNYKHSDTSHPGTHSYKAKGVRYKCTSNASIEATSKYSGGFDNNIYCANCGFKFYNNWSESGQVSTVYGGRPSFHYYYVKEAGADSCYSYSDICTGNASANYTTYTEPNYCYHDAVGREIEFTSTGYLYKCKTCALIYLNRMRIDHGCSYSSDYAYTRVITGADISEYPQMDFIGKPVVSKNNYISNTYDYGYSYTAMHRTKNFICTQAEFGQSICGQVVTSLTPLEPEQEIGAGGTINTQAYAKFLNGKIELVTCQISGIDNTKYNEWQDVTLSYGTYSSVDNKNPRTVTIRVYMERSDFELTVTSEDESRGTVTGGGSYMVGSEVTVIVSPAAGNSFDGWYQGTTKVSSDTSYTFTMPAENITLMAKFITNSYILSVESESGAKGTIVNSNPFSVPYQTPVTVGAVAKEGFSFAGWYTGNTLKSSSVSYTFEMPAENVSLVARFNTASYKVSFDSDGGSACSAVDVSYLGAYGSLPVPAKSGYVFGGWKHGERFITSASAVTLAENHTLKAVWIEAGPAFFLVDYGSPYGDNSWSRSSENIGSLGLASANLGAWLPAPARIGYTFLNWYLTENSKGNGDDLGKSANLVTKDTIVNIAGQHTVHAGWKEKSFTLSFDSNGGSSCGSMTITYDRKYGYHQALPEPSKTGCIFGGWYTSELDNNGCGTRIYNGDRVQVVENQTLYAKWTAGSGGDGDTGDGTGEPETITVTYYPGGTKKTYSYPGYYNPTAAAPSKTGYDFAGYWLYNDVTRILPDGTTSLQEGENHSVYAAFTPKRPVVTLDQQGATADGVTSVTATYGEKLPDIASLPVKTGYQFGGYYTKTGGTGERYYDENGRSSLVCSFENDITLYAYWIKKTAVIYNSNGGTGSMEPTYLSKGVTTAYIKDNGFTRTGYEFTSWNTKADGSGTAYYGNTYVGGINSDLTLYAQWKVRKNVIIYMPNGADNPDAMANTELAYNVTSTRLAANAYKRSGYTFAGWAVSENGSVVYADRASVTVNGSLRLYAVWKEKTISYTLVYRKYPFGSKDTSTWKEISLSFKDIHKILGEPYEPAAYTVSYDLNKPSTMSSKPANSELGAENVMTGIPEFESWRLYKAAGTGHMDQNAAYRKGEQVSGLTETDGEKLYLYPEWSEVEAAVRLPAAWAEGYTFLGWSESKAGSTAVYKPSGGDSDGETGVYAPAKDTTLYAQWEPNIYTVTFDYQKPATSEPVTGNSVTEKTVTFDAAVGTLPAPQLTGRTFIGWYTEPEGQGTKITASSLWTMAEDVTLYADWESVRYTVTLDQQGATTDGTKTTTATFDTAMPSVTKPVRQYMVTFNANTGTCGTASLTSTYTFDGYFTGKDGTGTQYYKADGTSARVWDIAQDTTLYAKWTSQAVTLPAASRTGYTFAGWYTAASGGTEVGGAGVSYTPTADITLYAQWTAKEYDIILNGRGATSIGHTETVHMTFDQKGENIIPPQKTGYTFQGYYTDIRGTGTKYYDAVGTCVKTWTEDDKTELYAYWIQDLVILPEEEENEEPTPLPELDTEGSIGRTDARGLLYADDYNSETDALTDLQPYLTYDTSGTEGVIPGTEQIAFRAKMGSWMLHYKLHRNTGTDDVRFYVTVPYRTQFERSSDEELIISPQQTKTYVFVLPRVWSYWEILESGMYYPEKVRVTNEAMKNAAMEVFVNHFGEDSVAAPSYEAERYGERAQHVFWEEYDTDGSPILRITLTEEQYIISDVPDTMPDIDKYLRVTCLAAAQADNRQASVRSDRFILNGQVILSDEQGTDGNGAEINRDALGHFASSEEIQETSYLQTYSSGVELDEQKMNGKYKSSAEIVYIGDSANINVPESITVALTDINDLQIHTPVVCNGEITEEMEKTEDGYVLTLKEALNFFTVFIDNTGTHRMSFGYGAKDFSVALSGKSNIAKQNDMCLNQVQFPFNVYVDVGNDSKNTDDSCNSEGDYLLPAGTWLTIGLEEQRCYVPVTMKNGEYQIRFRTIAVNCPQNEGEEYFVMEEQKLANLNPGCYVAADVINVEVRSYLRDFNITSVNATVAAEQLKNGCQALTLKKGYGFSYELLTQGEFYGENAKIHLVPSYFWESEDGLIRQEVKLYHLGEFPRDAGKECYAWEGEPILLNYDNYKVILQRFKGDGLVPADILCVAKDFSLEEYAKQNTFTGKEDFFLQTGYLIIHFDITVESNDGDFYVFDTWENTKLAENAKQQGWNYIPGDIIRYDLSKSIVEDYEIGGSE